MLQAANIEDIFRMYFYIAIIPQRIIELGTLSGEFSNLIYNLRKEVNEDFDFKTFDNTIMINNIPEKMSFCQMDIFEHISFIGSLIKENTLILCDNGDKIREVHLLAPYLKKNCVIMAHDYYTSKKEFEENPIWPHCEITDEDVEDLNLRPYLQEMMRKVFWLSRINYERHTRCF